MLSIKLDDLCESFSLYVAILYGKYDFLIDIGIRGDKRV